MSDLNRRLKKVESKLAIAREDQADHDWRLIMVGLSVKRELQARQFQNTPLEEEKRTEPVQEYRTVLKDKIYPNIAPD